MPTKLPRCFFTMNVDGMPLGTIVFELCADICPKTCENFMYLCTGKFNCYFELFLYKLSSRLLHTFCFQGGGGGQRLGQDQKFVHRP